MPVGSLNRLEEIMVTANNIWLANKKKLVQGNNDHVSANCRFVAWILRVHLPPPLPHPYSPVKHQQALKVISEMLKSIK